METQSIGFIGGGRITRIILTAFKNASKTFQQVTVLDPNEVILNDLKSIFEEINITSTDYTMTANADILFLAVHPPVVMETLAKIKDIIQPDTILVSLAPKLTILKMSEALGEFPNIARINPSASSFINEGLNPVCYSPAMTGNKKQELTAMMESLGSFPEVTEPKIEAYAMISAMGHTYFWFQIQKLKELAVEFGMDEEEAKDVVSEMLWGTTETLFNAGLTYAEVVDLVPIKPLGEVEDVIKGYYDKYLITLFGKIKP
jgi:pyrroline-5-carboxylate reductase